jgi:hypothetical protein
MLNIMNGSSFSIYICKVIYVSSIASGMRFFQIADGKVPFQDFFSKCCFLYGKVVIAVWYTMTCLWNFVMVW